jgi:hypothetical protein
MYKLAPTCEDLFRMKGRGMTGDSNRHVGVNVMILKIFMPKNGGFDSKRC